MLRTAAHGTARRKFPVVALAGKHVSEHTRPEVFDELSLAAAQRTMRFWSARGAAKKPGAAALAS